VPESREHWPRAQTCLIGYCPEKGPECWRCDRVCEILEAADKREEEFSKRRRPGIPLLARD